MEYIKVSNKIILDKKLKGNDTRVLLLLMSLKENITQENISKKLNLSLKTVKNSIYNLKKLGYLSIKKIGMHEYKYILNI